MAATDPKLTISVSASFIKRDAKIGFNTGFSQSDNYNPETVVMQPGATTRTLLAGAILPSQGFIQRVLESGERVGYGIISNLATTTGNLLYRKQGGSDVFTIPPGGLAVIPIFDGSSTGIEIAALHEHCDYNIALFQHS